MVLILKAQRFVQLYKSLSVIFLQNCTTTFGFVFNLLATFITANYHATKTSHEVQTVLKRFILEQISYR